MTTKKKTIRKKAATAAPKKDLTETGFSVIINDKGEYLLVTLKYDLERKQAEVSNVEKIADKEYQALYRLEAMLAKGELVPLKGIKK